MSYATFHFLHVLGAILLIGNVTVTSVWKVFADRSRKATVIAFAQRLVTVTDWAFTVTGVTLVIIGGYGMAWVGRVDLLDYGWLVWGQALFALSGAIWLGVLVPIQIRQARLAHEFNQTGTVTAEYRRLGRRWLLWGVVATIPLVAALWLMIAK